MSDPTDTPTTDLDREAAMQELADLGQMQGDSTPEEAVVAIAYTDGYRRAQGGDSCLSPSRFMAAARAEWIKGYLDGNAETEKRLPK